MADDELIVLRDGPTTEFRVLYASPGFASVPAGHGRAGLALPPDTETPSVWVSRHDAHGEPRPVDLAFVNQLSIGLVLFDADDRVIWWNDTYRGVMGPNAHLLRLGDRFADIMAAAYRAGHAAGGADEIEDLIAARLARHRNHETFEEALSGDRRLLTQEIAIAEGGTLGVRTIL